jgi:hypothetical protein
VEFDGRARSPALGKPFVRWKKHDHKDQGGEFIKETKLTLAGIITLTLALTACGPGPGLPGSPEPQPELPDAVETAAKEELSNEAGIVFEEIELVSARPVDWPDACLGMADEDEICAQVVTPGWELTLRAEGEEYVVHTDRDASAIRMEEPG